MFTFKKPRLTKDREAECIDFITEATKMTLDQYLEEFHKNPWTIGKIVYDFFTLPPTNLHREFRAKISLPHRALRTKTDEDRKSDRMKENIKLAQDDPRLEKEMPEDRRYKIIKTLETMADGKILVIGIPYDYNEPGRGYVTKYAYTTNISEKTMPKLFAMISDNMLKNRRK